MMGVIMGFYDVDFHHRGSISPTHDILPLYDSLPRFMERGRCTIISWLATILETIPSLPSVCVKNTPLASANLLMSRRLRTWHLLTVGLSALNRRP